MVECNRVYDDIILFLVIYYSPEQFRSDLIKESKMENKVCLVTLENDVKEFTLASLKKNPYPSDKFSKEHFWYETTSSFIDYLSLNRPKLVTLLFNEVEQIDLLFTISKGIQSALKETNVMCYVKYSNNYSTDITPFVKNVGYNLFTKAKDYLISYEEQQIVDTLESMELLDYDCITSIVDKIYEYMRDNEELEIKLTPIDTKNEAQVSVKLATSDKPVIGSIVPDRDILSFNELLMHSLVLQFNDMLRKKFPEKLKNV